ncbi:hypothetical protein Kpol_1037p26 [Vanderwaltozyma polyspora DSM 70294]|uniref:SGTA homodimerisation domain-containing protein n=1 Tax=Vanderwaltozyma polyspora (strain ATCC 22028 / DSM 70294 / BCRC 21397 / CBS 2163 / NBRC 10782 / NRRL Y-8283 / UCD 57-17) TaxID=436907 RepID=A7TJW8_VANPO|nr:uncharacterized protein Kpol_1037p26 [Vanderwaltozyma polyspora DSM 70294]EDO17430.1 hypothetical protein Kpol_1037p26 [Vanderwaltozyma polyspora DSM 70294]
MSVSNKDIAALIIDFLSTVVDKNEVSEDNADSLNVAMDCIAEAFEFERDSVAGVVKSSFQGNSLSSYLNGSTSASAATTTADETVKVNVTEDDTEASEAAEALKLEGNKAMAGKDYELAIKKYTEAIATLPTNAVYFANRAAAYSSLKKYDEAVEDANSAIKINPTYSKGYSRLGFAKFAQGKAEDALEAYKKVLDIEGDKATEMMKRDYETAKKKVEQSLNLEKSTVSGNATAESDSASAADPFAGMGGMPDFSSMLGGGGLGNLLNNPQLMQAAQQMMQDPEAMKQVESMMQNPSVKQMADQFSSGNGTPDFSALMNDPSIRDMAKNMFGNGGFQGAPPS